jgi:S-adenosylmethionine hydrolase
LSTNRQPLQYSLKGYVMHPTIALLTDFGTTDTYVGVMKAVMANICPGVQFIDLTHAIPPQNVRAGALALLKSYRYFPSGTVFLVVVDPGVGGARRAIAVRAGEHAFIAPDNGILSYALGDFEGYIAHELTNPAYQLPVVSDTFHGRDIFAPAAAHLAAGVPLESLGASVSPITQLPMPQLQVEGQQISGQVIHIDHFGNIITNIGQLRWGQGDQLTFVPASGDSSLTIDANNAAIRVNGQSISSIRRSYSQTNPGDLLALVDSGGFLEVALNQGNAAAHLNITLDTPITLQIG